MIFIIYSELWEGLRLGRLEFPKVNSFWIWVSSPTINLIMSVLPLLHFLLSGMVKSFDSFKPQRGLRQEDPLYLIYFVLCMEKLSLMIQQQITSNNWKPIKISQEGPSFSHLLLADDCLLFTEGKSSHV